MNEIQEKIATAFATEPPSQKFNPRLRNAVQRDRHGSEWNEREPPGWAQFGGPGKCYRYALGRRWGEGGRVCWVMLNPSTAGGRTDDATIRKVVGFSERWGFGRCEVVNVHPYRATDPADLLERLASGRLADWPYLLRASAYRVRAFRRADQVVVAWGANGSHDLVTPHVDAVLAELRSSRHLPVCLGTTRSGAPRHPGRISYDTERRPFKL